jgi:hypothetical protein
MVIPRFASKQMPQVKAGGPARIRLKTGGRWNNLEATLHIDVQELTAVLF